jgi:hypothetical protein
MCVRTCRSGLLVEREEHREPAVRLDLHLQLGTLLLCSGDGIGSGDEAARRRRLTGNRDERSRELRGVAGFAARSGISNA